MTKKLKTTLTMLMSVLIVLCALACFLPNVNTAQAETVSENGEYFVKLEGARVRRDLTYIREINGVNVTTYPMMFSFKNHENYSHFLNVHDFANGIKEIQDGVVNCAKSYQVFEFTLRHRPITSTAAGENTAKKIITLRVVFSPLPDGKASYAASTYVHDPSYVLDQFEIPKYEEENTEPSAVVKEMATKDGFKIINSSGSTDQLGLELHDGEIYFVSYLSSFEESYDVVFDFWGKREVNHGFLYWGWTAQTVDMNSIISDTRSVKQWLQIVNDAGLLEEELDASVQEEALLIATGIKYVDATVSYLVPVEGTPLATRKTVTVENVPVKNTELSVLDVRTRLGETLNIFNTTVYKFDCVDDTAYRYDPYYLKDALLESSTKEDKTKTFFYGLNTSFSDTFAVAKEEGLISNDEYEWALWQIYADYPEALGNVGDPIIYDNDLYGRFGIISLPDKKVSIQGVFVEMFGKEQEQLNIKLLYEKEGELTKNQYNALLNEYGYSSYAYVWENLFAEVANDGKLEATHYLFYASPGKSEIKEEDVITPGIKDTIKNSGKTVGQFFKALGNILGWTGSAGGFTTVLIIAGVGVGGFFLYRSGFFSKLGNKKNKKK